MSVPGLREVVTLHSLELTRLSFAHASAALVPDSTVGRAAQVLLSLRSMDRSGLRLAVAPGIHTLAWVLGAAEAGIAVAAMGRLARIGAVPARSRASCAAPVLEESEVAAAGRNDADRGPRPGRPDLVVAAAVGMLTFALYLATAWHLVPLLGRLDYQPFGGDTRTSAHAMLHPAFEWKHPLFSPVTWPFVALLEQLPGVSRDGALRVALALLAAANVILMYALLRRLLASRLLASWFAALYALLGVNLLIFAIPETYSTTNLSILAYLLAFAAFRDRIGAREATRLGAVAGIASLCNPPLLSLLGIPALYMARRRRLRPALGLAARSLGVALSVFAVVNVVVHAVATGNPLWFFERSTDYAARYASWSHFAHLGAVATVAQVFLLASVIAPIPSYLGWPSGYELRAYLASPGTAAFVLLYAGWGLYVTVRAIRGRDVVGACLLAWIAAMLLFYVYWDPSTATRFSPQILAPLIVVLARPFARYATGRLGPYALLGAASTFLAVHNVVALFGMG